MQEVFYEESATLLNTGSAKTKYYVFKTFSVISYVVAVVWFIVMLFFFPLEGNVLINLLFAVIPFALFLASGIIMGRVKDRFYVDYDYTFVSGSIRFSRVIKNIKRKSVLKFDTQNIEKIGRFNSDTFNRYAAMPDKKQLILTSNTEPCEGKDFYYLAVSVGGQRYLLILECTELFMSHIIRFSSRTIIEDGFFNKKQ